MHCLNCSEQLCSNLLAGSQFLDPDGWFPNHVSMHVQRSHLPCSSECLSGSLAATCSTQCSGARGSLSAVSAYLSRASGSPFHRLPHDSAATWSYCSSLARPPGVYQAPQSAAEGSSRRHTQKAQLSSTSPAPCPAVSSPLRATQCQAHILNAPCTHAAQQCTMHAPAGAQP